MPKVWYEKVKRGDTHFPTTYPIYFHGDMEASQLVDGHAPRTLEEAERIARALIEDETTPWTHASIYELRAVSRFGTERAPAK